MNYIIENNGLGPTVCDIDGTLTEQEKKDILLSHISNGIKAETENKILKQYPYYKQLNLQNSVIEVMANSRNRDFTESELEIINESKIAKAFIDSLRNECKTEIAKLYNL